uniref:Uncharacterized protein n=1 Tax=Anguilla anguilla TaxID=7936 RepID=A0A0E9TAA2_ANGAN
MLISLFSFSLHFAKIIAFTLFLPKL